MYKYLEIIQINTKTVVKRMDVTDKSERGITKLQWGVNINLNHKEYETEITESETELELDPKVENSVTKQ